MEVGIRKGTSMKYFGKGNVSGLNILLELEKGP